MIKFFRRIRQKLLTENKFSKYLIYALGEIALVMIGILLALQVNNWNERKAQIKMERSVLMEMRNNLVSDFDEIHQNIVFDSTYNESTKNVLNHLVNKIPFDDSLRESYGRLGWGSLFAENTAAFENLKTIGFNLISNEKLRTKVTFLYSTRYEYLNEILNKYYETLFDKFRPALIERTSSKLNDFFDRRPNHPERLFEDLQFQELLREDIFAKNFCIQLNRKVEVEVAGLISLIDEELSR